mgnify:FL=1
MTNLERFSGLETGYSGMLYPMETDHMQHANVRYYSRAFNETAYYMFTFAGITPEYMRRNNLGMAAVEEHSYYRREIHPGDHVVVKTCFIDFSEKWLHVWSVMINRMTDEICAINDQRCLHFDTERRKSCPFPADIYALGKSMVRDRPEV